MRLVLGFVFLLGAGCSDDTRRSMTCMQCDASDGSDGTGGVDAATGGADGSDAGGCCDGSTSDGSSGTGGVDAATGGADGSDAGGCSLPIRDGYTETQTAEGFQPAVVPDVALTQQRIDRHQYLSICYPSDSTSPGRFIDTTTCTVRCCDDVQPPIIHFDATGWHTVSDGYCTLDPRLDPSTPRVHVLSVVGR
jgi:hypothetical protein